MCGFHGEMGCKLLEKSLFQQFLDVDNKWIVMFDSYIGVYNEHQDDRERLRGESAEAQEKEADI